EILNRALARSGLHDYCFLKCRAVALETIQKLEAVDVRHHQVEQDHRIIVAVDLIEGDTAILRGVNFEALLAEESREESPKGLIIVDDQHGRMGYRGIRPGHWTAIYVRLQGNASNICVRCKQDQAS